MRFPNGHVYTVLSGYRPFSWRIFFNVYLLLSFCKILVLSDDNDYRVIRTRFSNSSAAPTITGRP